MEPPTYFCNLVLKLACQKTTFRTKIGGGVGQGSIKKLGPLRIFATVEASNFKFGIQIGFGTSLPKRCLGPKLAGVLARVVSKKVGTPTFSATVETSNFKFGIQLGFGTLTKKNNV